MQFELKQEREMNGMTESYDDVRYRKQMEKEVSKEDKDPKAKVETPNIDVRVP